MSAQAVARDASPQDSPTGKEQSHAFCNSGIVTSASFAGHVREWSRHSSSCRLRRRRERHRQYRQHVIGPSRGRDVARCHQRGGFDRKQRPCVDSERRRHEQRPRHEQRGGIDQRRAGYDLNGIRRSGSARQG